MKFFQIVFLKNKHQFALVGLLFAEFQLLIKKCINKASDIWRREKSKSKSREGGRILIAIKPRYLESVEETKKI